MTIVHEMLKTYKDQYRS